MKNEQAEDILSYDLECVDPEVRASHLYAYLAETLSAQARHIFDDHLFFCRKCQEDRNYLEWAIRQLQAYAVQNQASLDGEREISFFLEKHLGVPLPVTSIHDGNQRPLRDEYYEKPLLNQLAAAGGTSAELTFPFTVEYAGGQVVGEFLKRAGYLFFRMKKSAINQHKVGCTLIYTSPTDPPKILTFDLEEGDDRRLGLFQEFVSSNTIQGMLAAIKQFQVIVKKQE